MSKECYRIMIVQGKKLVQQNVQVEALNIKVVKMAVL